MDLQHTLQEKRERVNKELKKYFEKKRKDLMEVDGAVAKENYDIMQDYILGGGKRLRAICALMGYEACGGKSPDKMILPSLSVEFFHNSSLILDDVMDEDKERRDVKAAHTLIGEWFGKKFGKQPYNGYLFANAESRFSISMSTIATNMLFSLGAQTILDSSFDAKEKTKALHAYEKTYRMVNLGQLLDMYYEYEKKITSKDYLKMAYLKTGVLLGCALKIGGIFAGAGEKQLEAFDEYAKYAATTFQIQDDILDVTPGSEKGRELGSDLKKGKTTLLLLLAKENLESTDWKILEKVLGNENAETRDMEKAMATLHEKGIVEQARRMANEYNEKGKAALRKASPKFSIEHLAILDGFADYLMRRTK